MEKRKEKQRKTGECFSLEEEYANKIKNNLKKGWEVLEFGEAQRKIKAVLIKQPSAEAI